jgi:putative transposase
VNVQKMTLGEPGRPIRFRVRDRDSKFTGSFDEVFRSEAIRVIRTPVQAPKAKAHAGRWAGSLRRELPRSDPDPRPAPAGAVVRAYIGHHGLAGSVRPFGTVPPVYAIA